MVFDQVRDVQLFQRDYIVALHQLMRQFVQIVLALVGDALLLALKNSTIGGNTAHNRSGFGGGENYTPICLKCALRPPRIPPTFPLAPALLLRGASCGCTCKPPLAREVAKFYLAIRFTLHFWGFRRTW
jgi:hypothetical protein